ncbi:MAG: DUF1232 domain-containing protein [Anaerolineales bacterium]|nr:DUF1232 domain-containing protein [Anaerolineales bacterium]
MLNKPDEEFIKEGAQKVTDKDLEKVVNKSEEIKKKFNTKGPLARFVEDGKLLIAVIKDYSSGKYRQIPYGAIASIVFSLIYVFNPFDLMPDMLPLIGQVDDVAVMGACLMLVEQDLHKYKDWKQIQGKTE